MGLQFYFGSSGAGKSSRLHEEIVRRSMEEPETNFFVIVPDQFSMQTQMDLVKAHPRKGIMNIDVLSFGRLSHRILEEVGADGRMVLDDTGKSLVLRKVAENIQEEMPVIGSNLRKIGYIHEVKSVISEFMQYGIGEKELVQIAEYAQKRGALYHKLKDLEILYKSFLTYIHEKYITTEETLDLLCDVLPKSKLIRGSVIAFDGFTGFTPIQNRLIQRLMALSKEVIVTVTMDAAQNPYVLDGEQKLFYLSKKTVADLRKLAVEAEVKLAKDIFLKEDILPRFKENEEMRHLEKYLFRYPAKVYKKENTALHLLETSSPGEEVRQVCIKIRQLIRQQGYCYRDFAIVTGNLEAYAGHMETEASKFEIPVFMDKTRGILLNPFIEYIRSSLKIVMENFSYQSVFHYLRSGLAGFDREETDRLENYVIACGIKGKTRWMNLFTRKDEREGAEEELARFNAMREKFIGQIGPLIGKANTAGERVRALYQFITDNKVQEKLAAYEKMFERRNEAARAKEYGQIYRLVMDLLDQIESLLSQEKMTIKEFADILDAGFGEIEVGTIPQNVDRVVVGDIERTRLKEIKVLFFIGINDGNIPKNAGMGGIISDIDREFLQESPYALAPTPRQQMYIQRLYLYMNMTKPSEQLYLSYCKVNSEGKSIRPAYLIDTVSKLFPCLHIEKPELSGMERRMETRRAGLDYLTDMLREYAAGRLTEEEKKQFITVYRTYREDEAYRERIDTLAEAAFTYYREKVLGKNIANALYGNLLLSSVSRLETYAACAYAHFLQYGLSLDEREEYSFEAVDMGNVFHGVLELFSGTLQEKGYTWFDFGEEAAEEMLLQAMEGYAASYGNTVLYSTARNEYAIERMHRILKRTVMTLQYQLKKGSFLPENFEMSFMMAENLEAVNIALSEKEKIKLRGRIDRIDTYEDEEHVYVKVIDYKSGNRKFNLAALYYGLQLQLVVYMNAAVEMEKKKHPEKEVVPAALLYYHVADPMVKAEEEVTPEQINGKLLKELRMTGVVTENDKIVSLLDGEFADKSDVVPVERKKDGSYSAKSSVIKAEDMKEISDYVNKKIKQIGTDILRGKIEINPCEQSGGTSCDYCVYKNVCGFEEGIGGYHYRRLENLEDEEVMERIRGE
ncbi:helicase-exonuclease AddAB subunit AddB [Kineothrix sp. MB12-C1]|uniref:helicase-exonuclease AddAB subunit AddB n=1 Tax=Kineothrix sp. MB12-C1 TaxID=3070215 RepID=UPI0027D2D505|nr:helicase-exonuclease AddAB subunit AddB [Kineothrix sp. MB12-C1]WMC91868.1 helicase-exonuclease AddAB subunit AddB [Kineothrix sp. MB12-C1]